MESHYHIRRLVIEDLETYFTLRLESLENAPANFMTSYREEKSSGILHYQNLLSHKTTDNLILGAYVANKLIGIIGIYQEHMLKARHKSNIWGLYVKPSFRHQGIGKALLNDAVLHATHVLKSVIVNITVEATNITAKKLYESFGFKEWGKEPCAMQIEGQFFDECHMSLLVQ